MKTYLQFILGFAFLFLTKAQGQTDGTLDTSFNTGTGFANAVWKVIPQPDGKILVGGQYNSFNGNSDVERITRLNPDGSLDASFTPAVGVIGSYIGDAYALQTDGKILIKHSDFDFVRLNSDGSLDASFTGGYINNVIHDIVLQPDGKILLGGRFTEYQGETVPNMIVRLNTDGSVDPSFATTGTGFFGTAIGAAIDVIKVQPDGKIIVGGNFATYNGQAQGYLARLNADGSLDTSFQVTTQFTGTAIIELAIQADGKILVGGSFGYVVNGETIYNFIRLNPDGTLDTSFNVGAFSGTGFYAGTITSFVIQPDGKILVGGGFTTIDGQPQKGIARLNIDGSLDTSFEIGAGFNDASFFQLSEVNTIALQPDGKVIAGGAFKLYNGQSTVRIARLYNNSVGAPAPPSDLTATPYNSILLNWQDNSTNEDGFYVESTTDINGTWELITTTGPDITSYVHSGLINGVEYFYRIRAFNSFGESTYSNTASAIEETLSFSEANLHNLHIYPNPAKDFVIVANIVPNAEIKIYDLTGRLFHTEISSSNETKINTENFVSGTYFISIETTQGKATKQIIKK